MGKGTLQPFQEYLQFTSLLVTFASGDSKQHFAKCQLLLSPKATPQTNEGHKVPSQAVPEGHQLSVLPYKPIHELLAQHRQDRAAPAAAWESFGNKAGKQTKSRLWAPLEAGPQTFLKQENLAVSWRALDVFSPKASFITSCCFISCLLSWTALYYCNSIVRD